MTTDCLYFTASHIAHCSPSLFCPVSSNSYFARTRLLSLPQPPVSHLFDMDAQWQQHYSQHYLQQQAQTTQAPSQYTPTHTYGPMTHAIRTHQAHQHQPYHPSPYHSLSSCAPRVSSASCSPGASRHTSSTRHPHRHLLQSQPYALYSTGTSSRRPLSQTTNSGILALH